MSERVVIKRALISVSDKTGLIELAAALAEQGVQLVSTGSTAKQIADAGIAVIEASKVTGFPESLDGREDPAPSNPWRNSGGCST